jgi:hypothetical protein
LLLLAVAGFIAYVALTNHRLRTAEGFFDGRVCLPLSLSAALLILATTLTSRWRGFGFWLSLALLGQAISLQLIDAGTWLHYQHYYRPIEPSSFRTAGQPGINPAIYWLLIPIAVQAVLVAIAILRIRSPIAMHRRRISIWRLLAAVLLTFLFTATVSRHIPSFFLELPFASLIQLINLATIFLAVRAIPAGAFGWLEQLFSQVRENGFDAVVLAAAIWATAASALLAFFVYQRHPHLADELVYLHQARMLAHGALSIPAPPVPEAFDLYLMDFSGNRWFAVTAAGWPAILAVGVLAGVPWLVNPVLAGVSIILAYLLVQELYNRATARLVVLLLSVSPWFLFMAMSYMTHTWTLTCALAAALGVVWAGKTNHARWAFLGGIALGIVGLIRPLEGVILAALLGLWSIGLGGKRLKLASIASLVIGAALAGSFVLPYNKRLSGHALKFPINAYLDKKYGPGANDLGFGANRGLGWALDPFPGHGLRDVIVNNDLNLFGVNTELHGWSIGSLTLIAIALFFGTWQRSDRLMLAVVVAVIGTHALYWFSGGPDFGARYWYLTIIPFAIFTVRGIQTLSEKLGATSGRFDPRVLAAVAALCLLSVVNYIPWRAFDKYFHYLNIRPEIVQLAAEHNFGKSLVLIRGDEHPDYVAAAAYNPLDFNAPVPIYARDDNPKTRAELLRAYPDRPVWILLGPTLTHRGYQIVSGPLRPDQP